MKLTITEDKRELARLEGIIKQNLSSFYEVGRALMEIRNRKLYQFKNGGAYATFEAYCKGEWDFSRRNAYYLIDAAGVVENVNLGSQSELTPVNERQARPLTKLAPEQQKEAWQKAVETAPEGKITAAHVYKVVKEMTGPEKAKPAAPPPKPQEPSDAMFFAGIAISQLERIHPKDPKREEAIEKVERWIKAHKGGK